MNIATVVLHNFRSISDVTIHLQDYSVVVGENNCGKSTLMTALRMFYEDAGLKYDADVDFPKFAVEDGESWIELHFCINSSEQLVLKEEYRSPDGVLRVRRFFRSEVDGRVRQNQSNIYGYEGGSLSRNLFYGARNVSQAKLGTVVFIPEVTKADDAFKLTGPSPFRQIVSYVVKNVVTKSSSFAQLREDFEQFNAAFKDESSRDGFSVSSMVGEVNDSMAQWGIRFGIDVNPVTADDIVRNLVSHYVEDTSLGGQRVGLAAYGQGLQRHLIFTLIRISPKYAEGRAPERKEFAPDFTLLLFEEPEAFLHPHQQARLNASLRLLGEADDMQVLVTTHSPHFVSRNVDHLTRLIRLHKLGPKTQAHQIMLHDLEQLLDSNSGLFRRFSELLESTDVPEATKATIRRRGLGSVDPQGAPSAEDEAIRYFLVLNPDRASMFFARHVIICEGQADKALLDRLLQERWTDLEDRHIHVVDALGKFSIHRYMAILSAYGITHSVIMDADADADIHAVVNEFIREHRTRHTSGLHSFDRDIEHFLGIDPAPRPDLKPLHMMSCYNNGRVSADCIAALRRVVDGLLPTLAV
jgi:energy-coupling factor transporter ATP-binding protein EcfA2